VRRPYFAWRRARGDAPMRGHLTGASRARGIRGGTATALPSAGPWVTFAFNETASVRSAVLEHVWRAQVWLAGRTGCTVARVLEVMEIKARATGQRMEGSLANTSPRHQRSAPHSQGSKCRPTSGELELLVELHDAVDDELGVVVESVLPILGPVA
jgi:hypothetical protein